MIYILLGLALCVGIAGFIYLKRKIDSIDLIEKDPSTGTRSLFSTLYGKP